MHIVKHLGEYRFFNEIDILSHLPVKNYRVDYNETAGLFLVDEPEFTLPGKLYDVDKDFRDIVLKSFRTSERNTGVLLEGEKGFGKSVMAKQLSIESNLPVIMITKKIPSKYDAVAFLNQVHQEFVLFIDEFEKIYVNDKGYDADEDDVRNSPSQHVFLSYMDGNTSNEYKKLIILTSNDTIDDKFINRPSRIKFYKEYRTMDEKLFHMIIEDRIEDPAIREDLVENLPLMEASPDLLMSIIDEVNKLGIPYSSFKMFFNHKQHVYRYDIYQKIDDRFEYFTTQTLNTPINRATKYLNSFYDVVVQSISVDGDDVIFNAYTNPNRSNNAMSAKEKMAQVWKAVKSNIRDVKFVF